MLNSTRPATFKYGSSATPRGLSGSRPPPYRGSAMAATNGLQPPLCKRVITALERALTPVPNLEQIMNSRFLRFAIIIVLLLLAAEVAQPYVTRLMFAQTTPRPIAARGDMSDIERSFVELFQRISPSVVQIAGQQDGGGLPNDEFGGRRRCAVRDRVHLGCGWQYRHQQSRVGRHKQHGRAARHWQYPLGGHRRHRSQLRSRGDPPA